ncbi:hypothetical protein F5Y05DRAFT_98508 [Hypoxylon sp. FL0543]|nr:hypothetical protein F5Y05DRAFT_98508 [Hypoxylon sp. FL0543]
MAAERNEVRGVTEAINAAGVPTWQLVRGLHTAITEPHVTYPCQHLPISAPQLSHKIGSDWVMFIFIRQSFLTIMSFCFPPPLAQRTSTRWGLILFYAILYVGISNANRDCMLPLQHAWKISKAESRIVSALQVSGLPSLVALASPMRHRLLQGGPIVCGPLACPQPRLFCRASWVRMYGEICHIYYVTDAETRWADGLLQGGAIFGVSGYDSF